MKITKKLIGVTLFSALLFMGACSKYEDGPAVSLLTKKARLSRAWVVEKYIDGDDGEVTAGSNDDILTFFKDGNYSHTSGVFNLEGTWSFINNDEDLQRQYTILGITSTDHVKILRLTTKELWVQEDDNDKIYYKAK